MENRNLNFITGGENILIDGGLDKNLIMRLVDKDLNPEKFYLTGFETLSFSRNKLFAVETVFSSMMTFDKEVLIITSGEESKNLRRVCERQSIQYSIINIKDIKENLDVFLRENKSISHVVICDENTHSISQTSLRFIGGIANRNKVDFVLVCTSVFLSLDVILECGISFMIGAYATSDSCSVVVAQRSKLVQAEGQSRSQLFDLHDYWQRSLVNRNHIIEPMAV